MRCVKLKCLSVRQPWAWAIVNDFKPVENRSWPTKLRGPVLIHAGAREESDDVDFVVDQISRQTGWCRSAIHERYEAEKSLGAVVGGVRITDCVTDMDSEWFFGRYGFVLAGGRPCRPVPLRGRLGFFTARIEWRDTGVEDGA